MKIKFFLALIIFLSHSFANAELLTQSFANKSYHYSIRYPANWICNDHGGGVVVFKNNLLSMNIQTIFTKQDGGKYASVKDLMDDFRSQVPMHTQHAIFLDRRPIVLAGTDGTKRSGEQTTLTFFENGQTFKQWQVMTTTKDGNLFEAWAYRAPLQYFDTNREVAEAVLASWMID